MTALLPSQARNIGQVLCTRCVTSAWAQSQFEVMACISRRMHLSESSRLLVEGLFAALQHMRMPATAALQRGTAVFHAWRSEAWCLMCFSAVLCWQCVQLDQGMEGEGLQGAQWSFADMGCLRACAESFKRQATSLWHGGSCF